MYTNELHEALLHKQGVAFWKCWKSKYENNNRPIIHVNGLSDANIIAERFASHFSQACTANTAAGNDRLRAEYARIRADYFCQPTELECDFDAELVELVIFKLKCGKAAGLDGLSAEHLLYSHPLLPCVLAKLFNMMVKCSYVPRSFGKSYTVPLLKNSCNVYGKSVTVDDFRGISISPVLSKVLEHCILDRHSSLFVTSDNQFGFKKQSGCSHAIYMLRCITDYYVSAGSTVNICAIDVSKAFDKMNHYGLFIKLMQRCIPVNLLVLFEHWFSIGMTCVKWCNLWSSWYNLSCGIRQGGVLSPYLFAVYIDSLVDRVQTCGYGCYIRFICVSILLYADDILLVAPSVSSLQLLLHLCEKELDWLDLSINVKNRRAYELDLDTMPNVSLLLHSVAEN